MRRTVFLFALMFTLSAALVGCTSNDAPDVTPVPTPAVTHSPAPTDFMDEPDVTDDAHYDASKDGQVEGDATTPPAGTVTRNAVDRAGKAVRDTADDVRRGVDDMMY